MMKYKGYAAEVEYDEENRVFSGRVVNTRTVITFHGTTVDELEDEFHTSVDDYLQWCVEDNIVPERPYSGRFNVRIDPSLHQQIACAAKSLGMSINSFIVMCTKKEISALAV